MYINVYVSEEEYARIKDKDKGYIRSLVQKDLGNTRVSKGVEAGNTRVYVKEDSPFACKKCGSIKVSGKCIICK